MLAHQLADLSPFIQEKILKAQTAALKTLIQILFHLIDFIQVKFPEVILDGFHEIIGECGLFGVGKKIGASQVKHCEMGVQRLLGNIVNNFDLSHGQTFPIFEILSEILDIDLETIDFLFGRIIFK